MLRQSRGRSSIARINQSIKQWIPSINQSLTHSIRQSRSFTVQTSTNPIIDTESANHPSTTLSNNASIVPNESNNPSKKLSNDRIDIVIYHANCWDGFGAAWVVHNHFKQLINQSDSSKADQKANEIQSIDGKQSVNQPRYHAAHHSSSPPDVTGLNVLIVDFCYPLAHMKTMLDQCASLLVIDHHISSEKDIASLPDVNKAFDMNESGALLTWQHFNPSIEAPKLIRYIADKDMWRFKLPQSHILSHALKLRPFSFKLFDDMVAAGDRTIDQLIDQGTGLSTYIDAQLLSIGQHAKMHKLAKTGHNVMVVNSPLYKSELGHQLSAKRGVDFAMVWHFDHASRSIIVSLRNSELPPSDKSSDKKVAVDVSEVAAQFGGGGHPRAAAFRFKGRIEKLIVPVNAKSTKQSSQSTKTAPIDEEPHASMNENSPLPYVIIISLTIAILYFSGALGPLDLEAEEEAHEIEEILPSMAESNTPVVPVKPRLVILGSGWGAVSLLKGLDKDAYDVVVVSPRNYFLFTPLLPSATTGQVESRSLMEPIRRICHRINARFYEGKAVDVDLKSRLVICRSYNGHEFTVPYDQLVVAVGAKNNTFGTPNVRDYCYFVKEIKHARKIRHKLLSLLEEASLPGLSKEERERMLSILVVGGGPTGVEFAAEFHDLLVQDIRTLFPDLAPHISLSLIQSQDHILNTYDESISKYAEQQFRLNDIRLITGAHVEQVHADKVIYKDKKTNQMYEIPFGMCVWSTGIDRMYFTQRLLELLSDQQNPKGKAVLTDNRLRVHGAEADNRIYALGDAASVAPPRNISQNDELLTRVFTAADVDGDGQLSYGEFSDLVHQSIREYPVLSSWLASGRVKDVFVKYDKDKSGSIDPTEFKDVVLDVESKTRSYPATAQVASQQGEYLASRFNAMARSGYAHPQVVHVDTDPRLLAMPSTSPSSSQFAYDIPAIQERSDRPFKYHHLASLAYVGGEKAAFDLGNGRSISGWAAFWLWKSVYLSTSVSMRTRWLLASDWARTWLFGRDVSKR